MGYELNYIINTMSEQTGRQSSESGAGVTVHFLPDEYCVVRLEHFENQDRVIVTLFK